MRDRLVNWSTKTKKTENGMKSLFIWVKKCPKRPKNGGEGHELDS